MIPFERTLPYDIIMKDVYVPSCPFCSKDNVLLPLRPRELSDIHTGKKRLLVFPCCHNRVTVVDVDQDYLLTDTVLRRA
ncbi:hypothetical protein GZH47_22080 [Paenibacillus rhizovicinus]|uniref:Uncharacterized protein n=1 Tax=Paenibacillus rhizovicinus TaxID=2704463 RepID=A0A6C0P419_9BACL|nr:hypothetical protein [Paenibacillus rhizovicinus]QHW33207.1 hypothetical protein GZH47_22080 [Paenibacillus rhizovicinus]